MGAFSSYLENTLLNATLRGTTYPSPGVVYLALFISDPTPGGTGTEVTGGAYVRQPVNFNQASNGSAANAADVIFPVATGAWGTVGWFGIYDAQAGGNLLYQGALGVSKTVSSGDQVKLPAGNLTLTLS